MKLFTASLFFSVVLVHAQISTAIIKPHSPATGEAHVTTAAAPVLGYVLGSTPTEVIPVLATSVSTKLGDPLPVPAETVRVFLSPHQQYSLIEQNNSSSIAVWSLHRQTTTGILQEPLAVTGTINHPDLVAFSPRGESAALYSQDSGTIQLLSNLPAQPSVTAQISASGKIAHLVIADDAKALVAQFADGTVQSYSPATNWQALHSEYIADSVAFIPNSHALIISDTVRKTIALLPQVEEPSQNVRIIAQGIQADQITIAKGGQQLVAANRKTNQIWTIDVQSGVVTLNESISAKGNLSALRDGSTFAVIDSRSLSTFKVPALALNSGGKN